MIINSWFIDCWLWSITWPTTRKLLRLPWWEDPSEVDSPWGPQVSQILHCQWRLELWLCPLWDMVTWGETFSWNDQPGGMASYIRCLTCVGTHHIIAVRKFEWIIFLRQPDFFGSPPHFFNHILVRYSLFLQAMKHVMAGNRLPPPPGCPRSVYTTMIQCWYVTVP